jgi:hypothetical protein
MKVKKITALPASVAAVRREIAPEEVKQGCGGI